MKNRSRLPGSVLIFQASQEIYGPWAVEIISWPNLYERYVAGPEDRTLLNTSWTAYRTDLVGPANTFWLTVLRNRKARAILCPAVGKNDKLFLHTQPEFPGARQLLCMMSGCLFHILTSVFDVIFLKTIHDRSWTKYFLSTNWDTFA